MARDKAVLADKRMRVASSGFGHKPAALRTGSAGRYGAPTVRSPIKEQQSITVFGVCNVPDIGSETPVDVMVSVVTRGTSPTPPAHSTFLRSKHAGQQEFTVSMVPRKYEPGVDVNVQTDERFLRNMPSLKIASSIPVARYVGSRSGYNYSKSKDSGSTSDNSGTCSLIGFRAFQIFNRFDFSRSRTGFVSFRFLGPEQKPFERRGNVETTSTQPEQEPQIFGEKSSGRTSRKSVPVVFQYGRRKTADRPKNRRTQIGYGQKYRADFRYRGHIRSTQSTISPEENGFHQSSLVVTRFRKHGK